MPSLWQVAAAPPSGTAPPTPFFNLGSRFPKGAPERGTNLIAPQRQRGHAALCFALDARAGPPRGHLSSHLQHHFVMHCNIHCAMQHGVILC